MLVTGRGSRNDRIELTGRLSPAQLVHGEIGQVEAHRALSPTLQTFSVDVEFSPERSRSRQSGVQAEQRPSRLPVLMEKYKWLLGGCSAFAWSEPIAITAPTLTPLASSFGSDQARSLDLPSMECSRDAGAPVDRRLTQYG